MYHEACVYFLTIYMKVLVSADERSQDYYVSEVCEPCQSFFKYCID